MRRHLTGIAALALLTLPHAAALAQAKSATFTGVLSIMWGGEQRAELTLPDNTTHPLKLRGEQYGLAQQFAGQRVKIRGRMTGQAPATIVVDAIVPAPRGK